MDINKKTILTHIAEAAERMGLEKIDLLEMTDAVLDDCLSKIPKLRSAADGGDTAQLTAVAHDIKGSTISYGLLAPSAIAKNIEINKHTSPTEIDQLALVLNQIKGLNLGG